MSGTATTRSTTATATVVDAVPALALVPLASSSNCDLVQLPWLASSWMEAFGWSAAGSVRSSVQICTQATKLGRAAGSLRQHAIINRSKTTAGAASGGVGRASGASDDAAVVRRLMTSRFGCPVKGCGLHAAEEREMAELECHRSICAFSPKLPTCGTATVQRSTLSHR